MSKTTCKVCGIETDMPFHTCDRSKSPSELASVTGSTARLRSGAMLTKDELQVIDDLAWMVKNSKQNVGTRMKDQADSVRKIIATRKQ